MRLVVQNVFSLWDDSIFKYVLELQYRLNSQVIINTLIGNILELRLMSKELGLSALVIFLFSSLPIVEGCTPRSLAISKLPYPAFYKLQYDTFALGLNV